VTTIEVSPASGTLNVGDTLRLGAVVKDQNGVPMAGKSVLWTSSAPNAATVSSAGLVTAVAGGTTSIDATVDGKVGSAAFTIRAPVAAVVLATDTGTVAIGGTLALGAVVRDAQGATLSGRPLAWVSLDTAVARVNATGVVTAVNFGRARIIASSEGKADTATVRVPALAIVVSLDASTAKSGTIGASGGRIETVDGAGVRYRLDVPAGALMQAVAITMTPIRAVAQYPLSGGFVAGVELGPRGLAFATLATLTIVVDAQSPASMQLLGLAYGTPTERPDLLLPSRAGSQITISVAHLGRPVAGSTLARGFPTAASAHLNTAMPFTVGFGTVSNLINIQGSFPFGRGADGFDPTALINAGFARPLNVPGVVGELEQYFDRYIHPALQQATTDLQLLEAYSDFQNWREMPSRLVAAVGTSLAALGPTPTLRSRDQAAQSTFRTKAGDAIRGNFQSCNSPAAGIARPVFVENAFFWIHQSLQEGATYTPSLMAQESCARVAPPAVTMPNPVNAGTTAAVDAQFGLLFNGDPVAVPTHMQVTATAQGGTLDRQGGLTALPPHVGFYTTWLTAAAGPGTTQVDFVGCYSNALVAVTPVLQNLLCGTGSATRSRLDPNFTVATSSLPLGDVGVPYVAQLQSTGGTPPILWSIVSGGLPPGLTLDNGTGRIAGTPTMSGTFGLTARARRGPQSADRALSLTIRGGPFDGNYRGIVTKMDCELSAPFFCHVLITLKWLSGTTYCVHTELARTPPIPPVNACATSAFTAVFTGNLGALFLRQSPLRDRYTVGPTSLSWATATDTWALTKDP
jgi:hypothetical protein